LRLLLDTHAALWWLTDDRRLSGEAVRLLDDESHEILLSAAVVWEVAVKRSLGKLNAPEDFAGALLSGGAHAVPVTVDHAAAVEQLPWHHRDPFDRILVAQAQIERATLVSGDEALAAYGVPVVW
jgi:PIN domain nuclease of toxin-antitoxin system